jgi:hypothetical protein
MDNIPHDMRNLQKYLLLCLLFLSLNLLDIQAQGTIQLHFEGQMMNISQEAIKSDEFKLVIKIREGMSREAIYELRILKKTDQEGWFGFTIGDFHELLYKDQASVLTVDLEFYPTPESHWIEQGEDFIVKYDLKKVIRNDSLLIEIERIEGSKGPKLEFFASGERLYFYDTYPFAYLQGGFAFTFMELNDTGKLRSYISGENEVKSRGIKGGFPVGGYRKNK